MVKHVCNEVALWNSLWNLPIEDHRTLSVNVWTLRYTLSTRSTSL